MVNFHPEEDLELTLELRGMNAGQFEGSMLTAEALNAHNTFEKDDEVSEELLAGGKIKDGAFTVNLPAKSIVVLHIE